MNLVIVDHVTPFVLAAPDAANALIFVDAVWSAIIESPFNDVFLVTRLTRIRQAVPASLLAAEETAVGGRCDDVPRRSTGVFPNPAAAHLVSSGARTLRLLRPQGRLRRPSRVESQPRSSRWRRTDHVVAATAGRLSQIGDIGTVVDISDRLGGVGRSLYGDVDTRRRTDLWLAVFGCGRAGVRRTAGPVRSELGTAPV